MNKSKTGQVTETVEWNKVDWKPIQLAVFKLQKRIYQASLSGNIKQVRRLQKTLLNSWSSKMLATRKVTQDNQGKNTPGVDGVKSLEPKQRIQLAKELNLKDIPQPARRIYIPKSGKDEKRPLSIPTIRDRAAQALVKLALEPEWEARFEPNSYGFRPGRAAHDAIEAIFKAIWQKNKYVLDADISKCFDRIDHDYLLNKLNTFPTLNRLIKAWLAAGWVFQGKWTLGQEGTPQGGVISPLLANVALHGMENRIKEYAEQMPGAKKVNKKALTFIRYADDFVILHDDLKVIHECTGIIKDWLAEAGLELSIAKTSVKHTLLPLEGKEPGFDFLGFNIVQREVSHHRAGESNGRRLLHKTVITPSKAKVKAHYKRLAEVIDNHNATTQDALITKLNPIIKGWTNYYRTVCSKDTFSSLDHLLFQKLERWCKRRHPNKTATWSMSKYFRPTETRKWNFMSDKMRLYFHAETKISRHTKVKGSTCPFDGNDIYWSSRMGKHPMVSNTVAALLKRQKGKCNLCKLRFKEEDLMEVDHITPKSKGGKNTMDNLQLLHRHCHDTKTAMDLKACAHDKGCNLEEPYEVKVSRTVLKTSSFCEEVA